MPTCALCKEESPLRTSHIIPAFVFRWMRETSATGFFRSGINPRVRVQDGLKTPLLCERCEQRFSRLERQFANEIFYPVQRGKVQTVEYKSWFLKFCVSISWRVLTYAVQHNLLDHLSEAQYEESEKALARWARFLLDEVAHPANFEQRLVLLNGVESYSTPLRLEPDTNRYFMRGVDIDVGTSMLTTFTFAKIGPFALYGMVQFCEKWEGTKINANTGTIGPQPYKLPIQMLDYWMDRARRQSQSFKKIPAAQLKNLEAKILLDPKKFLQSGTFQALEQDVHLFGRDAFWKH